MEIEVSASVGNPVGPSGGESEEKIFQKLATFVLGRLTIAHSTAAVERIFSQVSCVKTKLRNRLSTSSLEAVLRYRYLQMHLLNISLLFFDTNIEMIGASIVMCNINKKTLGFFIFT
jgi:hypothetical protein